MSTRETHGFEVGDIVVVRKAHRYRFGGERLLRWEVVGFTPVGNLEIRHVGRYSRAHQTAKRQHLALVQTAEERVAEALMREAE